MAPTVFIRTKRRPRLCRKCGETLEFLLKGGFVPRGQPRYYAVNADDLQPHWKRCQLNQQLKAARQKERVAGNTILFQPTQEELFHGTSTV